MRIMTLAAIAALLSAPISVEPVLAQARKKAPAPKAKRQASSPALDMARIMESGGSVGCPNRPLSGRTARVAARLRASGSNCPDVEEAAPPPDAPRGSGEDERKVDLKVGGYTLYWERPGYCSLYLDTPRAAMVRFSLAATGAVNFSYVRPDIALDPRTPSYPAMFQFDRASDLMTYAAVDTRLDDGRAGFMLANAGTELLDAWASGRAVVIRLGTVNAKPLDTIELADASRAITQMRLCADPGYSPTVMPPPPKDISSSSRGSSNDRRFPSGERITLSFEPAGIGGSGTITRRAPGQPTKLVTIDYMAEFAGIVAVNRVRYNVMGTTDRGQEMWSCEAIIDWRTARIVSSRDLSPASDHPPCG